MRALLSFILLFLTSFAFCQISSPLNVSYNPNTNEVSFEYTGCDFCRYQTIFGVEQCQCSVKCDELTQEQELEFEECYQACEEEFPNNPEILDLCLDKCDNIINAQIDECKELCGEPYPILWEVYQYQYFVAASWDEIPFDPWQNQNNTVVQQFPASPIGTSNIVIPNW